MIQFNFEDQSITLPTTWDEVKVKHYIKPEFLIGDSLGLISSISGISIAKLCSTTEDLMPHFQKTVEFMNANPQGWKGEEELPQKLELLGKPCTIPLNIELASFGKKIMFGQAIAKHKFIYESIPEAIAIYLGDQIYDDWYERVDEIAEAVKELPIASVFRVADFFLNHSRQSTLVGSKD